MTQPEDQTVAFGSDATFTVVAEGGTPPITYQWSFHWTNLATTASLTVTNVQLPQCGPYSVTISDAGGASVTSTATLYGKGVIAWGLSSSGELAVPPGLTNVVTISSGESHNLALNEDGSVTAWANDNLGQLDIPLGLENVKAIAAGDYFNLALQNDGTLTGWGQSIHGELDFPPNLTNVVSIAAGTAHGLALKADGSVVGWGEQPGVPSGLTNVVAIAAGGSHDLALRADGTVIDWGSYTWTSNDGWIPGYSPADLTNAVAISAGTTHAMALKADGSVVVWGFDRFGETDAPPWLDNLVAIAAGDAHSIALRNDGTVFDWGLNGDVLEARYRPAFPRTASGDLERGVHWRRRYWHDLVVGAHSLRQPVWPLVRTDHFSRRSGHRSSRAAASTIRANGRGRQTLRRCNAR